MLIAKEKNFYKLLFSIALPIALQNLINFAVGMLDTLMLGRLGEVQLSAAAIGNNLFFILMILTFGLAGGSNIMISQYWGKEDVKSIHKILSIMYRVCIAMTIVFIFIAIVFPKVFMSIYTTDIKVIEEGVDYLRIVAIGYIFYSLTSCTIMMLRSVKTVKISLLVYSISLVVNGFFNWVFIFGNFGAPALGIKGAAIGTVIARVIEFVIVMIFMASYENKISLRFKHLIKVDKIIFKDFRTNCTPVMFNELLWSTGSTMISIIIGRLGTEVIAANSINNVAFQFVTVFAFGLSSAASVVIGNTIGEGNEHKAKEYAFTIGVISIAMGIIAAIVIYFIRPIIVDFYNVSELTKFKAMEIMSVTSIIVIFQILGVNLMMGVLRGGGDAKFVLINDLLFMWTVAIPMGFVSAFIFKWPITVVFFIMKSDEILKSLIAVGRVISGKWIRNVTRNFAEEQIL